jgi:hypothetical protein
VSTPHVRLVDAPEDSGRTTATLVASLAARLGVLHLVSGSDAVGSLAAGFAALGREVAKTADGARLRRALEGGEAGSNGDVLWSTLRIESWVSSAPPTPVLDQLRNDVALLLADDLRETLELMPIPAEPAGERADPPAESTFADLVLGLWAFSRELVAAVETLAEPTLSAAGSLESGPPPAAQPEGELLR